MILIIYASFVQCKQIRSKRYCILLDLRRQYVIIIKLFFLRGKNKQSKKELVSEKEPKVQVEPQTQKGPRLQEALQLPLWAGGIETPPEKRKKSPNRVKMQHILKSRDFARVLEKGDRIKGSKFSLYVLDEADGVLRAGVIIPKKLARRAVQRNYLKRLIYAVFLQKAQKRGDTGTMAVVRLISDISSKKRKELFGEIKAELESLLKKSGMAK